MRYKFFKKTNEARGRAKTRRRADLKIPALFWEVWDPAGKDSRIKDSNRPGIAFFHRPKVASFLRPRTSLDAPPTAWSGFALLGGGNADGSARRRDVQPAAAVSGFKTDVGCSQYDASACGGSRSWGWEDLHRASWSAHHSLPGWVLVGVLTSFESYAALVLIYLGLIGKECFWWF